MVCFATYPFHNVSHSQLHMKFTEVQQLLFMTSLTLGGADVTYPQGTSHLVNEAVLGITSHFTREINKRGRHLISKFFAGTVLLWFFQSGSGIDDMEQVDTGNHLPLHTFLAEVLIFL